MIKKTITYQAFDGSTLTEDFYFGFSQADIIEMQLTAEGNDFRAVLKKVIDSGEGKLIMAHFKDIIFKSYGQKTADGRGFEHSEELSKNFMATDAYNKLFVSLVTNTDAAADFINGVVPSNLEELVDISDGPTKAVTGPADQMAVATQTPDGPPVAPQASTDGTVQERGLNDYTEEELRTMPQSEFDRLAGTEPTAWSQKVMMIAYQRRMQG